MYGFGTTSFLAELRGLNDFGFDGFDMGFGFQFYISDDMAFKLAIGIANQKIKSYDVDIDKVYDNLQTYTAYFRYNLSHSKNVFGYIAPFYRFTNIDRYKEWVDGFTTGKNSKYHSLGFVLGAEWFAFHNFSIGADYAVDYTMSESVNYMGRNVITELDDSSYSSALLGSKLNFVLSFYFN